ncbi:MAG TPA: TlpA family protein disulfide reductase [Candidatus Butyricimonas faecavium]|nr:TlpA family protein disulfide reductase [Candidatus Butyricimonas faecavium]
MKKIIILLLFIFPTFFSANAGIVKISGSLKEFKMKKVEMRDCGIAVDIYNFKRFIEVDSMGSFQLELKLNHPAYYQIGDNLLYLSPGDNLKVKLGRSVARGQFQGIGEEANIYLKGRERLSIWKIFETKNWVLDTSNKRATFDECRLKADSLIEVRLQELNNLTTVDDQFRELETIRIKACQVQIYLDYFLYGQLSRWDDSAEVKQEKKNAFYQTIKFIVEPLLKELVVSDNYLELSEVRGVLNECYASDVFEFPQSATFLELMQTQEKSELLNKGIKRVDYKSYKDFRRSIQNKDLKQAFSAKLQKRATLMEGRLAPDILLKDIDGNELRLSDLKGKPLFIDMWATWCLPCLFQRPDFQKLSEKYTEIQFVGISIDLEVKRWKEKLEKEGIPARIKEYLADTYALEDSWDLTSIPRFILIDKDFKIITAFAPPPSEKEEIEAILESIE